MTKLFYFLRRFGYNALPEAYFKKQYARLKAYEANLSPAVLEDRVNYYCKIQAPFEISNSAVSVADYKRDGGTEYYLDLKEFLHYFNANFAFNYKFGDNTQSNDSPTLCKARTINTNKQNAVLFKLNKRRHFQWVKDKHSFSEKKNSAVWRGAAYLDLRRDFIKKMWQHSSCDIGQTNSPKENVPWQKPFVSIDDQLQHKFIFCIEGNDVATNLKWVMSSNSLCLSPKMTKETWFMEGRLEGGVHYVELEEDYSNLDEIIAYYCERPQEAQRIIDNAHSHVQQFLDPDLEDLLCLKVLEKYAFLSGQVDTMKFSL